MKAARTHRPGISRAARSFVRAYAPEQLWLVHRHEPHEEILEETHVRWIPAELLDDALSEL